MRTPLGPQVTGDQTDGTLLSAPSVAPAVSAPGRYTAGMLLSGKYRLDSLLGEGGMGAVWRATNLLLELPVAIKLIRADLDRGSLRARLQVEARSAAKLGHPAIVRVFDVGQSEAGDPFIVMELLQGESLATLLDQGRMSGARAVQILLPIIDALGMAHARGIVHRDLKPDNVMIAVEDQRVQPKILDFGIAKLTDPRDEDHKLTEVGAVVGSPDYMSPEQARGLDDLDAATDIWSICVVLYEAITGKAPFDASNYNALLRAIVEDDPKSIVAQAAGDEALWQIIKHGLAKDRRDRYATMSELGQALATWLVGHGVHEDVTGTSLESKWLGRPSEPRSVGRESGAALAISSDFQPNLREARDVGTGVARGPFTATIRPHAQGRKRAFGIGLAILALLGVSGAVLSQRHEPQPANSATQASVMGLPAVSAASAPPPATLTPAPLPEPMASAPIAPAGATQAPQHPQVVPVTEPAVPVTEPVVRSAKAVASARTMRSLEPVVGKAAPSNAPTPPAKPPERPLDLLAPY